VGWIEERLLRQIRKNNVESTMECHNIFQRLALVVIALAGLVFSNAASTAATLQTFEVGTWHGEAYSNDQTGRFSHCAIVNNRFPNGDYLSFVLDAMNQWSLRMGSVRWTMRVGINVDMGYAVNGGQAIGTRGRVITGQMIEILLGDGRTLLPQLTQDARLNLSAGDNAYRFDLTAMSDQLTALVACVKRHSSAVQPQGAPERQAPQPDGDQAASKQAVSPVQEAAKHATANVDQDGNLLIAWNGEVVEGMTEVLRGIFAVNKISSYRVILVLDSPGGAVEEGEMVIHLLQEIRKTHKLRTWVHHGSKCASMCIPIFLQGDERVAARDSAWGFHEAAVKLPNGKERVNQEETLRLFRRYYVQAGVSRPWLESILPEIRNSNLWRTGQDLAAAQSGIITFLLNDREARSGLEMTADDRGVTR
jgi:ATP-dependent protease ClpP protease subunit